MTAVENYHCSFEFVDTEIKTECENGEDFDLVYDPIDVDGHIQIKEEVDVKREKSGVDDNHVNSHDEFNNLTVGFSNNVAHSINHDPLARSIINGPQAKNEFCEKYKIHQSWLDHSYYRIVHPGCKDCPYKASEKEKEDTTLANKLNSDPGLVIEKLNYTKYQCEFCTFQTFERSTLQAHTFNKHLIKRVCSNCGRIYPNSTIRTHMSSCRKKSLEFKSCNICTFKTLRTNCLEQHLSTEHPKKNANNYLCEKCGKILDNKLPMRSHYFECPGTPFIKCNYCTFRTKYSLCIIEHLLRQHCNWKRNNYECPQCSKKFIFVTDYQNHLFECLRSCYMQCDICSYKTRLPSNLTEHVLTRHYRRKKKCLIPCTKCGCRLDSYISWTNHMSKCEKN